MNPKEVADRVKVIIRDINDDWKSEPSLQDLLNVLNLMEEHNINHLEAIRRLR